MELGVDEIKNGIQKKYKKTGNGSIETAEDFSVILVVHSYLLKLLKNNDDD